MKKSFKFFLTLAAVAATLVTACNPKDEPTTLPTLDVEEVTLTFPATGNKSQTFEVVSDGQWIANGPEWITITPATSKGNAIVTVTVQDNVDASGAVQAPRSGKVTVTLLADETKSFTITVEQEGDAALDKSHTYNKVSAITGGKAYLLVTKNTEGKDIIPILFGATSTYGYPKAQVVEVVDNSIKLEDGDSGLIFTAVDGGYTIQQTNGRYIWHQSGYNTWSCSDDLGTDGYIWTVEMQADGTAKIVDTTSGGILQYGNGGYTSWAAYASMDDVAVLPFLYEDTQDPVINTDKLACSTSSVTVASTATEATFKIVSNLGWTVAKTEGDWVKSFTESGQNDGDLVVTFDANETEADRVAKFTLTSTTGDKTLDLTLTQSAPISSYETLADVIKAGAGDHASENCLVVAVGGTNTVVYDKTAYMFIYDKNKASKVGDILELSGATTTYNGCPEWNNPTITVKSSDNAVEHPQAVVLDEATLTAYKDAPVIEYAEVTGTKSGYLITVGEQVVSVYSNETIPDGKVVVRGYTIGYNSSKSQTLLVATSFEEIIEVPDAKIYINEVACGEKKLELYNASESEVSLKGYTLKQRNDSTAAYKEWNFASLAEAVTIPAGGFAVVNCKQSDETTGPTFGLSGTKGFQLQLTFGEEVIDAVDNLTSITTIADTQSYGRVTDGAAEWVIFGTPSIGESNAKGKLVVEATTCAEVNAALLAGKTSVVIDFADYIEVTYVNGKSVFAQDATGGVLFYGTGLEGWAYCGLRFKGYLPTSGTVYNGVPELTGGAFDRIEKDYNAKYPCINLTLKDLLADYDKYVNCKVLMKDLKVTDGWQASAGDRDGKISDGTNEIAVRAQVSSDSLLVKTGCEGNIVSWPTYYKTNKQLGFWPHVEKGKSYFTVTKEAPDPDQPADTVKVYNSCAEANAAILAGETAFKLNFSTPVAVTKVAGDGKSIYLMDVDNGGGLLIYNKDLNAMAAAAGVDHNWGVKGEINVTAATVFNGLPEITAAELTASNLFQQWKYPCKNITIADLLADNNKWLNCKLKITGVTVTDGWAKTSDKNGKIAKDGSEIALYVKDTANETEVKTGCEGDAVVWAGKYNDPQVLLWSGANFTVTKEAPVDPVDTVKIYTTAAEVNAAILAGETSVKVNFADFLEITLVNGKYVFAEDATGGLLLYGTGLESSGAYGGLRFKGEFTFTTTTFKGLPQITAVDGLAGMVKDYNAKYPCANLSVADLAANYTKYLNRKVKISGVTVEDGWQGSTDRDGKVAKDGASIAVRAQDVTDTTAIKTGCEGNIVAFPSLYNTTPQLSFFLGKHFTVTKEAPVDPVQPVDTIYANCGEVNAAILAGKTSLKCNFESPAEITLMGCDNKSVFVQDATGGMLIYSADLFTAIKTAGAKDGYAIKGEFTLGATVYNGLPEVTSANFTSSNITGTWKYPCKNLTIADLLADFDKYLNCKVKIADVDVTDGWSASDKNGEIAQGDNKLAVYVKNGSITTAIPTGSKGAFVGYVAYNKTTKQVTFWEEGKFIATSLTGVIDVKSTASLVAGDSLALAATVNSGAELTYASDNEAVATVSATGLVKAIAAGTANITITAPAKDKYTAASATVAVTVTAAGVEVKTAVLDSDAIKAAHSGAWSYTSGKKTVTAADGTTWELYNTYASTNQVTIQMNKGKGCYILSPTVTGNITKVIVAVSSSADGTGTSSVTRTFDILDADGNAIVSDVKGDDLKDGVAIPGSHTQVKIIPNETNGGACYVKSITLNY